VPDDPELRRLLWYLLGGTRGGENRARMIQSIRQRPCNLNQLAKEMNVDYRSVQHHAEVLVRNRLVVTSGERYGLTYSVSPWLEHNYALFDEICTKLKFGATPTHD